MIVKLCNANDLPLQGELKSFRGGAGFEICIARPLGSDAAIAFDNHCPHQHAPLSAGYLEGCNVVCPYHAWKFNVTTGRSENPADPELVRYSIRQYGEEVFIQLPNRAAEEPV